jgi:hypothetical protein
LYLRKSLDYEVAQTHNLTIVVTDEGLLPQRQATSSILVTVQDVNDNTPVSIVYKIRQITSVELIETWAFRLIMLNLTVLVSEKNW